MRGYKIFFYLIYRFVGRFEPSTTEWGTTLALYSLMLFNVGSLMLLICKFFNIPLILKSIFLMVMFLIWFVHYFAFIYDKKYGSIIKNIEKELTESQLRKSKFYLFLYAFLSILIFIINIYSFWWCRCNSCIKVPPMFVVFRRRDCKLHMKSRNCVPVNEQEKMTWRNRSLASAGLFYEAYACLALKSRGHIDEVVQLVFEVIGEFLEFQYAAQFPPYAAPRT